MKIYLRFIKILLYVLFCSLLIVLLFDKFYEAPPSFEYRLYIKNNSSYDFIFVRFIQLTDIMARDHNLRSSSTVIPKNEYRLLRIGGECDAPSTLFALFAYQSTSSGRQIEIPLHTAYFDLIPFADFRSNTFSVSKAQSLQTQICIGVTDASFRSTEDYVYDSHTFYTDVPPFR